MPISRRDFVKMLGIGAVGSTTGWGAYRRAASASTPGFTGAIMGANAAAGHLLRRGVTARPNRTERVGTLIVGGGIAGLSAAWWLRRNGVTDVKLLEMDGRVGGNSVGGRNAVSAYPWGAHYVPLPGRSATHVREFFEEIGVITGYRDGLPVYDEYYLCADPQERLFIEGRWQDGLVPQHGIRAEDRRQYDAFFAHVDDLKKRRGADGRRAFEIPLDASSRDPELLALDRVSMAAYMRGQGWTSAPLNWYVNYCCRDDYGAPHDRVSAWAGLHYFAARSGSAANADAHALLTWPEGNGFLVDQLRALVRPFVIENALAFAIESSPTGNLVDVLDVPAGSCTRFEARHVIYAAPRFTAPHVIRGYVADALPHYAPWMVANVTVRRRPGAEGAPLSWDNVSYRGRSLGYIVATHQDLTVNHPETVLTYYLPLDHGAPAEERALAHRRTYRDWVNLILPDLEHMHPGLTTQITNLDVWVWGHGMVSPGIGWLWGESRRKTLAPFRSVHFAHSDMSGISIFEEAQYRGVVAARAVLAAGHA